MLMDAHCNKRPAIRIVYRTDGHLNRRRMETPTRQSTSIIPNLLFADDCALSNTSEEDMERSLDFSATDCANSGLTINTEKTVVMHQPLPNVAHNELHTNVNGAQLRVADTSTCLSSTLSRSIKIEDEMGLQISKASQPNLWSPAKHRLESS
ncbi:DNA topoisomerase 2-beta [Sparganum proliferum]